ncbi:MAG: HK97 gp10 family phage protein [Oscillospiraceae bacterium]|jgi:HK97 gp10 family phage protein|nr:HK97 gp10 family phage protein [Oscillospiraceae bacterium]
MGTETKTLELRGVDELLKKLNGADGKIRAAIAAALEKNALAIVGAAKRRAPVDTGDLRGMIGYNVDSGARGVTATISAHTEYAVYVEFGTGDAGDKNHSGTDPAAKPTYTSGFAGMDAYPYLYPAFKAYEKILKDDIANAAKSALK